MSARTPEQAVDRFLERLRRVATCITTRPVIATGNRVSPRPDYATFAPRDDPIPLRAKVGTRRVFLTMKHDYLIREAGAGRSNYHLQTVSYIYALLDRDGNEVLAYHWHPVGSSHVVHPHLHLSDHVNPIPMGRAQDPLPLADVHIASGFVELADIVPMLIEELDVQPLREDWRDILVANRATE
jgi:hypothetical protein